MLKLTTYVLALCVVVSSYFVREELRNYGAEIPTMRNFVRPKTFLLKPKYTFSISSGSEKPFLGPKLLSQRPIVPLRPKTLGPRSIGHFGTTHIGSYGPNAGSLGPRPYGRFIPKSVVSQESIPVSPTGTNSRRPIPQVPGFYGSKPKMSNFVPPTVSFRPLPERPTEPVLPEISNPGKPFVRARESIPIYEPFAELEEF